MMKKISQRSKLYIYTEGYVVTPHIAYQKFKDTYVYPTKTKTQHSPLHPHY